MLTKALIAFAACKALVGAEAQSILASPSPNPAIVNTLRDGVSKSLGVNNPGFTAVEIVTNQNGYALSHVTASLFVPNSRPLAEGTIANIQWFLAPSDGKNTPGPTYLWQTLYSGPTRLSNRPTPVTYQVSPTVLRGSTRYFLVLQSSDDNVQVQWRAAAKNTGWEPSPGRVGATRVFRRALVSTDPWILTNMMVGFTLRGTRSVMPQPKPVDMVVPFLPDSWSPATLPAFGRGVRYEYYKTLSVADLNDILTTEQVKFKETPNGMPYRNYSAATAAVKLYQVFYSSVIPEKNSRPTVASGLIAIPDRVGITELPIVSYQHGTVYLKDQVPSTVEKSYETSLAVAVFAGCGKYAVVAADYFGMGFSTEYNSYFVKASEQQATMDMIIAGRTILQEMNIVPKQLFLSGWSQGGLVTMYLLERLQEVDMPVRAASTAAAPADFFGSTVGSYFNPRSIDANWITIVFAYAVFSFEEYYNMPGLAYSAIRPEYYEACRDLYLMKEPIDFSKVPLDGIQKMLRPEFSDQKYYTSHPLIRRFFENQAFRFLVRSPTHMYYGEVDEVLVPLFAQLPAYYQKAMGSTLVEAYSAGSDADHRGAFLHAIQQQLPWFDQMLAEDGN